MTRASRFNTTSLLGTLMLQWLAVLVCGHQAKEDPGLLMVTGTPTRASGKAARLVEMRKLLEAGEIQLHTGTVRIIA